MAERLGTAVLELITDSAKLIAGIKKAKKQSTGLKDAFIKIGGVAKDVLGGVAVKAATQLVHEVIKIGKESIELTQVFETSMNKIVSLVGIPREQMNEWSVELLEIAPELRKLPQELAEGMFFVTSAGLRGSAAMDALVWSAKASAAGLGEVKTIASTVASVMNAYGSEVVTAEMATDILVGTVREGALEAQDLAGVIGKIIPIASNMGVEFEELGAAIAAMSRTGTGAAEGVTYLGNILNNFLTPAQNVENILDDIGLSADEMRRKISEEGLLTALQDLKEAAEEHNVAFSDLFPSAEALAGALDLLGANAEDNAEIFDNLKDTAGLTKKAFDETADTIDSKLAASMSKTHDEMIKMGKILAPLKVWFSELKVGAVTAMGAIVSAGAKFFDWAAETGVKIGNLGRITDEMADTFSTSWDRIKSITNEQMPNMLSRVVASYQDMSDETAGILEGMADKADKEYTKIAESVISGAIKMWERSPAVQELELVEKIKVAQSELQKGTTKYVDELEFAVTEWDNQLVAINNANMALEETVDTWEEFSTKKWREEWESVENSVARIFGTTLQGKIRNVQGSIDLLMEKMLEVFVFPAEGLTVTERAFTRMQIVVETSLGETLEGIKQFIDGAERIMIQQQEWGPITGGTEYFTDMIDVLKILLDELETYEKEEAEILEDIGDNYQSMADRIESIMEEMADWTRKEWLDMADEAVSVARDMTRDLENVFDAYWNWRLSNEDLTANELGKILERQAKVEKAFALMSITINTAAAVIKYALMGRIGASIAMGVFGAAQFALVAATPIPAPSVPTPITPTVIELEGMEQIEALRDQIESMRDTLSQIEVATPEMAEAFAQAQNLAAIEMQQGLELGGGRIGRVSGDARIAGATFEQQRPIIVTIDVHDNQVLGGDLREFAVMLREEFLSLDELGV